MNLFNDDFQEAEIVRGKRKLIAIAKLELLQNISMGENILINDGEIDEKDIDIDQDESGAEDEEEEEENEEDNQIDQIDEGVMEESLHGNKEGKGEGTDNDEVGNKLRLINPDAKVDNEDMEYNVLHVGSPTAEIDPNTNINNDKKK